MPWLPQFSIRQPQPNDLVDSPMEVCGVGTGFEGVFEARVRDGNGAELARQTINAGGTGIWGNFHVTLAVGVPTTAQGTLEIYENSARDGSEVGMVTVPVVFGVALVDPYHGFAQYEVVSGDTLSAVAQTWLGNAALYTAIFEANRDQISDPNLIYPGQVLRIPQ